MYYFSKSISADGNVDAEADTEDIELAFSVAAMASEAKELNPEHPQYVFYGILSVTCAIASMGIFAFIFNNMPVCCSKFPPFNVVDDGKWLAIIIYAIQFWDFASDVYLCIEIWSIEGQLDFILLIIAVGSAGFVIIPYITNCFHLNYLFWGDAIYY